MPRKMQITALMQQVSEGTSSDQQLRLESQRCIFDKNAEQSTETKAAESKET